MSSEDHPTTILLSTLCLRLLELLKDAAERRKYMPFVMQRISVAVQLAAALEIRQALGVGLAPE